MAPKVSVLVASYNNGRFLPACLDSLLQQSFADFEALVVDDCSTDNSLEIARMYSQRDARIRVIRTETNRGVTHTKQVGLQAASGEYVAILDSDDLAQPARLQQQVAWLEAHPDTVLVAGDYGVIDAAGKTTRRRKRVPHDALSIRWWLTFGNCLIHSTVMYRRQPALDSGGYDPYFFHGEDLDLYTKLLCRGTFAALPEIVSLWRSHRGSVTKYVAPEERERYYVELVQRSIRWQTSQPVALDVAAAVFYNTKQPARSETAFQSGIETLIGAFDYFYRDAAKNRSAQKILARCFIKHLVRLRKRNKHQPWWHRGKHHWLSGWRFLVSEVGYHWYADGKIWRLLPPGAFLDLLRSNWCRHHDAPKG